MNALFHVATLKLSNFSTVVITFSYDLLQGTFREPQVSNFPLTCRFVNLTAITDKKVSRISAMKLLT
jgi:hypothetical protein